ncbi:inositol monophosphatase family protein [Nocardioides sp.]|uniref:inositol monophosphatase family protein n=1 Tax=Nocardioides sp. TaxID=35761 RepID=UPI0026343393|nr:inositol monophosphatase family protein [Nocardioides sp.]
MSSRGPLDIDALADLALDTARAAADLVRERAAAGVAVAATKSSEVDVVTQADRDSEALIRRLIGEVRPSDAFLGEEGGATGGAGDAGDAGDAGSAAVRWIVDPIDGTVNFLYGLPEFSISIAAEVDGVLSVGVVLNVATGTAYRARRGAAGLQAEVLDGPGQRIGVRAPVPLSQQLVITGFSYDADVRRQQAAALVSLLPRVRDIRRHGSAALELCKIAVGQADAYVEVGVNLWDYAAGALIAEAAGARWEVLPGLAGRDLVVCAPAASFDDVRDLALDAGFGAGSGTGSRP